MSKVLYCRVGEDIHAAVLSIAVQTGVPVSGVVDQLLREALQLPAPPRPSVADAVKARAARRKAA